MALHMPKTKHKVDGKAAREFGLMTYVDELRKYDHAFLDMEGAVYFAKPFGFTARTYIAKANPNDPKGLTLARGADNAEGVAADDLAMQICDHVGVSYGLTFGRGLQLRICCDALEQWMKAG